MCFKGRVYYLVLGFFCFIIQNLSGQDQKIADSLASHLPEKCTE